MQFWLTSAILGIALLIPGGGMAQDHDADHHREQEKKRYYDKEHQDWHEWDAREDHTYRRYLEEKHRAYDAYMSLTLKEQRDYWRWRHQHADPKHQPQ